MKSFKEFAGENWKKYNERFDQRWNYATQQIKDMLCNDEQWNLFKQQLESRKNPFINLVDGTRARLLSGELTEQQYKDQLSILQVGYINCMIFICDDLCEYNPKPRKGSRKYTKPRRFYCDWTSSLKDQVAEEFAERQTRGEKFENVSRGLLWSGPDGKNRFYAHGNPEFEQRTSIDKIIERHTDPTKPPKWLDVNRKLCPYYYVDLTKP